MQKVRVTDVKVEAGKTGDRTWEKITITGEDGTQFTTFDTKAKGLQGALIELEPIVKGRYVNFEKWNVLEKPPVAMPIPGPDPATAKVRIQADFKIAALQVAGRLAAAGKIDEEEIPACADKIYAWLAGQAKTTPKEAEGRTAEELWSGMGREERDLDTLKTMGDLFTACLTDFKMQRSDVIKELGYSSQEEIGESPADCYRIMSRLSNPKSPLTTPEEK